MRWLGVHGSGRSRSSTLAAACPPAAACRTVDSFQLLEGVRVVADASLEVARTCGVAATARDCQHRCECHAAATAVPNKCDAFVFVPADADVCGGQALCQLLRKNDTNSDAPYAGVTPSPGAVTATLSGATSLPRAPPLLAGACVCRHVLLLLPPLVDLVPLPPGDPPPTLPWLLLPLPVLQSGWAHALVRRSGLMCSTPLRWSSAAMPTTAAATQPTTWAACRTARQT